MAFHFLSTVVVSLTNTLIALQATLAAVSAPTPTPASTGCEAAVIVSCLLLAVAHDVSPVVICSTPDQ